MTENYLNIEGEYMKHEMKLRERPFENIKNGSKTIEMRLLDEKRSKIKEGDEIIFTNVKTNETLCALVVALHKEKSFKQLYEKFNKSALGYAENETADWKDMQQYYSAEEQKSFGVVGIEIKVK